MLHASYQDVDGNTIDLEGESLEELAADLTDSEQGSEIRVYDDAGSLRGWLLGPNEWRAA